MNKKFYTKLLIGLSVVLLISRIFFLDFDNLLTSLKENLDSILVPILLFIIFKMNLRELEIRSLLLFNILKYYPHR